MRSLKLIAGLGNPGKNHERDRHNAGFWFVSRLAHARHVDLRPAARYHALLGKFARTVGELWLLLPQTFMNLSGKSVGALAHFYKIPPEEILVVHDELDFVPGVAKLKLGGGVAGHNGLKDIAARLGTEGFWRLRLGIGHPGDRSLVANYVLQAPPSAERQLIEASIERCLDISELLFDGSMEAAMLKLHTKR
jgi:PTH1 family peptidyl-tRNA hydrolase